MRSLIHIVILTLGLLALQASLLAQTSGWVKNFSNGNGETVNVAVAENSAGNLITAGSLAAKATWDGQQYGIDSNYTVYVAEVNPVTEVTLNFYQFFSTGQAWVSTIVLDGSDNVYLCGFFYGTLTMGSNTLVSNGARDAFYAKLDAAGNVLWAKSFGGGGSAWDYATALEHEGNKLIVGGYYQSTPMLDTFQLPQDLYSAMFIASVDDATGNATWVKTFDSPGKDQVNSIKSDNNGGYFIGGFFVDSINMDGNVVLGNGERDAYVARTDSNGNVIWAKGFGSYERDEVMDMVYDPSRGSVFVTGIAWTPLQFDTSMYNGSGLQDGFLAQFSETGNYQSVQLFGSAAKGEGGRSIELYNGNILGLANIGGVVNWNGASATATGDSSGMVFMYDPGSGSVKMLPFGSSSGDDLRGLLTVGGDIYACGKVGNSPADFDGTIVNTLSGSIGQGFLWYLGDSSQLRVGALQSNVLGNDTIICYGNCLMLDAGPGVSYTWWADRIPLIPAQQQVFVCPPAGNNTIAVAFMDSSGYNYVDTLHVFVDSYPVIYGLTADTTIDYGTCVNLTMDSVSFVGGTINWSQLGGSSVGSGSAVLTCPTAPTTYVVEVTNSNGCSTTDTVFVDIDSTVIPPALTCNDGWLQLLYVPGGSHTEVTAMCSLDNPGTTSDRIYAGFEYRGSFLFNGVGYGGPGEFGIGVIVVDAASGSPVRIQTFQCTDTARILNIAIDDSFNIYIAGHHWGDLTLGSNTLTSGGLLDGYAARLDQWGNVDWAVGLTGSGNLDLIRAIVPLSNGKVYLGGSYSSSCSFTGYGALPVGSDEVALFAELNNQTGAVNWLHTYDGVGNDKIMQMVYGGNGRLFISGTYANSLNLGGQMLTGSGQLNSFIGEADVFGNIIWAEGFGAPDFDNPQSLVYDAPNNMLYLAGKAWGDFAVNGVTYPAIGYQSTYLVEYTSNGNFVNANVFGSAKPGAKAVTIDMKMLNGKLLGVGTYSDTLRWNGDSLIADNKAGFLFQYNPASGHVDLLSIDGVDDDKGWALVLANDEIFVGGSHGNVVDFYGITGIGAPGVSQGYIWNPCDSVFPPPTPMGEVWPGDADNNGIANNWDILPIGLIYDSTGPARPSASSVWVGQPAVDWGGLLYGNDYKFVDCDGNGVVNQLDILPILQNYGLTHLKDDKNTIGPLLYIEMLQDSVQAGDTATFIVKLGTQALQASNAYGLAFSINYNPALVVSGTFQSDYSNSWLGDVGVDMITLDIELTQASKFDMGLTRRDLVSRNGSGEIARVSVVTIDNISGKDLINAAMPVWISNVRAIDNTGTVLEYSTGGDTLTILNIETGIQQLVASDISIYPNPADGAVSIVANQPIDRVVVYNMLGQVMVDQAAKGQTGIQLPTDALAKGQYFIAIYSNGQYVSKKLSIVR